MLRYLFLFLMVLGTGQWADAQSVTRGPYMSSLGHSQVVIRWRTDAAAVGIVRWGTTVGQFTDSLTGTSTTEHIFTPTGLQPGTTYYYQIGVSGGAALSPSSVDYRFTTHTTSGPVRVWALGDFGRNNAGQLACYEAFKALSDSLFPDQWMWLGDNAYQSGTQSEYQSNVFNVYDSLLHSLPFYSTPGNHEYLSVNYFTHAAPYYDIMSLPTQGQCGGVASGTESYYSWDQGDVHFVTLDSEWPTWVLSGGSDMADWLRDDLAANTKPWTVVYWHQPPYTKGSHDSDSEPYMLPMRQNYVPILEQYGVDFVVCGHSHVYERTGLLRGHTGNAGSFNASTHGLDMTMGNDADQGPYVKYTNGPSAGHGTVYAVVANTSNQESGPLNHPAHVRSMGDTLGVFIFEVNGNRLDATMYGTDLTILDQFSILKTADPNASATDAVAPVVGNLSLRPNPNSGECKLHFTVNAACRGQIRISDLGGRLVSHVWHGSLQPGEHQYALSASQLSITPGVYLVEVEAGGQHQSIKWLFR